MNAPANPNQIVMTISFVPGQPVQVNGPLVDKMLCYGMLEMARDAIQAFDAQNAPRIMVPNIGLKIPPSNGR